MSNSMSPETPSANASGLLRGSVDRALLGLWVPLVFGYFSQIAFNWIDTALVARVGSDALAAVGSAMFAIWFLFSLAELVTAGTVALVARRIGGSDGAGAMSVVATAGASSVVLGVVVAIIGYPLTGWIVGLLGLEPAPAQQAVDYLRILVIGYPAATLLVFLDAVFRGAGFTRPPMVVMIAIMCLNALLDWILIFGVGPAPALGVTGAALATVISRVVGCAVLSLLLLRRRTELGLVGDWTPDWQLLRPLLRVGAPASLAGVTFCVIYFGLVRITSGFGTYAVAALGLGIRLESIAYFVVLAVGRAAATFAAQNLGAGNKERARRGIRRALWHGSLPMLPCTIVMLAVPEGCVRLFIDDPLVVEAAASYLRILSVAMVVLAVEVVLDNVAYGVGDAVPAMVIEIVGTGLRIPIAIGLVHFGFGVDAVWWAVSITIAVKAVGFEVWFRSGRWSRTFV